MSEVSDVKPPTDDTAEVGISRHDYDVVLVDPGSSVRAGRVARTIFLVEFAVCIGFIVSGRLIVLFAIGAVISAQFFVLSTRIKRLVEPMSDDHEVLARLSLTLKELCIEARCAVPRLSVRRTTVPVALMARKGYVTLIVSPDFANAVDDKALRATIAHEIVHLRRGDLGAALQRTRLTFIGFYLLGLLAVWKFGNGSVTALILLAILLPAWLRLLALVLGFQNQPRELRADLEGAAAVGDPQAMIRGLRVVYGLSWRSRVRVYSRPAWRWALFPWSVRARSHPSLETRIEALTALESFESGRAQPPQWPYLENRARGMTVPKRIANAIVIIAIVVVLALLLSSHNSPTNNASDGPITPATLSFGGFTFIPLPSSQAAALPITPATAESMAVRPETPSQLNGISVSITAVTVTFDDAQYPAYLVILKGSDLRVIDKSKSPMRAYGVVVNADSGVVTDTIYLCSAFPCTA